MKKYKPTTPSRRSMTTVSYRSALTGDKPSKSLTYGRLRKNARNHHGRITKRFRGGGHKRLFREVDFKYNKPDIAYIVKSIEYDPNRSGFIGRVAYVDGEQRYVLLPGRVAVGQQLLTSRTAPVEPGNRLPLEELSVGTSVFNVEIKPGGGAKLVRSAGLGAEVLAKEGNYVDLKMPSTEIRKVHRQCWATVGEVSNSEQGRVVKGKAGRSRWLGRRPKVRGSAMNPVDHPYGGGEGRAGRGMKREKTKWGQFVGKRQKTRKPKKYSNNLIVRRRRVGKKR